MNIEEIDKWLDNEYGCSYTRLEELHDFVVEQAIKQIEEKDKEIERLHSIIKEVREYIEKHQCCDGKINVMTLTEYKELLEILDKVDKEK